MNTDSIYRSHLSNHSQNFYIVPQHNKNPFIINFISGGQIDFGGAAEYYDEKYFEWQKIIGKFGAKKKISYFAPYIKADMTVIELSHDSFGTWNTQTAPSLSFFLNSCSSRNGFSQCSKAPVDITISAHSSGSSFVYFTHFKFRVSGY